MEDVRMEDLRLDRLKEAVEEAKEKYYQSLQDIPRSKDDPEYEWHLNRSYAYQHKMEGMQRALLILIGKAA
jgi:hypothetical protein